MAGKKTDTPLTITIKAIDQASGPIRKVSATILEASAPKSGFGKLAESFAGFKGLGEKFGNVASAARNVGSEIGKLATKFATLAIGGGVAAFALVKGAVDAGDKLGEMAQRVGLGVDAYASLGFAMAQSDVDAEQFNASMDQFNKRLGEAKAGGGPLLEFLKKTGPGLAAQIKGVKSTEEGLSLMTDALARIEDPQRRAALAAAAFGKSGLQMGQALGQGSAAVQKLQRRYLDLSGSQEDFAKGAGELDNAMRESEVAFLGLRNAAAAALFPALTELSKAVTSVFAGNRDSLKKWATESGAAITAWVKGGGVERLVAGMSNLATTIGKVVDALGGPKGVALAFAAVQVAPLIMSVVGLGAVLGPLIWQLGGLLVGALGEAALAILSFNTAAIGPAVIAAGPFILAAAGIAAAGYQIYTNWDKLTFIFKDFWNGLVWDATQAWEKIKPIVDAVAGAFKGTAFGWALGKVSEIGDSASGALAGSMFDLTPTAEAARPDLSAAATAALPSGGQLFSSEPTKLLVDFANAPKGTRVSHVSGPAEVDLSVGYSMGVP